MVRPPKMPRMPPRIASSASVPSTCCHEPVAQQQELDQHDGEKNRERIVAAGFHFQRRADARAQPQPAGMDQEEHRRRIGRGHHGADQQRLEPAEAKHIAGGRRGERRGEQHPDGGEHQRGGEHAAEGGKARAQAAVEQDEGERNRAHQIGGVHVIELDPARPRLARQHAQDQEHQEQRRPEPHGHQARQDAGQHQERAQQNADADGVESGHAGSLILMRRNPARWHAGRRPCKQSLRGRCARRRERRKSAKRAHAIRRPARSRHPDPPLQAVSGRCPSAFGRDRDGPLRQSGLDDRARVPRGAGVAVALRQPQAQAFPQLGAGRGRSRQRHRAGRHQHHQSQCARRRGDRRRPRSAAHRLRQRPPRGEIRQKFAGGFPPGGARPPALLRGGQERASDAAARLGRISRCGDQARRQASGGARRHGGRGRPCRHAVPGADRLGRALWHRTRHRLRLWGAIRAARARAEWRRWRIAAG